MKYLKEPFFWRLSQSESLEEYQPGGYHPVHLGDVIYPTSGVKTSRYRILAKLGYGGFATVWLAEDLVRKNQCVALKVNIARLTGRNNEVKILKTCSSLPQDQLGSAHVVRFLDAFEIEGPNGTHEVIVTEVVCGWYPTVVEASGDVDTRKICRDVSLGVSWLHGNGITHGDIHGNNIGFRVPRLSEISPDLALKNLKEVIGAQTCIAVVPKDRTYDTTHLPKYLVEENSGAVWLHGRLADIRPDDYCPVILDFGGAFRQADIMPQPYVPLVFTPPELLFEAGTLSFAGDIWALGCTLSQLLFRSTLFGRISNHTQLVRAFAKTFGPFPSAWLDASILVEAGIDNETIANNSPSLDIVSTEWAVTQTTLPWDEASRESPELAKLMKGMLQYLPQDRVNIHQVLLSPWLRVQLQDSKSITRPKSNSAFLEDSASILTT
ncbi:kinase-like protein [Sistotremastrum suecicum HHB10207 ss-3]|uniref:Kinase-like protein n=1 Tax=Sistotremastrum suecicum HHB10207 ss-3 TaxID=1314776 RepID=A0A166B7J1_9AGAM|nr:kinase-like protein [Sistotremastrum suecicum HHB10207 ss-3]